MNDKEDIRIEEEEGLDDKLKKIREKLKKCQKEKEEYLNGWQRCKADFINARRDEEKNREELIKFSNSILISELLPVLDSFDLSVKSGGGDKGFHLIKSQLSDILKKHGLEAIEAEGKKFNPEFHEAVEEIKTQEESGTVVEEIQKGYTLHGKVLRAAKVKVSK